MRRDVPVSTRLKCMKRVHLADLNRTSAQSVSVPSPEFPADSRRWTHSNRLVTDTFPTAFSEANVRLGLGLTTCWWMDVLWCCRPAIFGAAVHCKCVKAETHHSLSPHYSREAPGALVMPDSTASSVPRSRHRQPPCSPLSMTQSLRPRSLVWLLGLPISASKMSILLFQFKCFSDTCDVFKRLIPFSGRRPTGRL